MDKTGKKHGPFRAPRAVWEAAGAAIVASEGPHRLAPGCWTTGAVPRSSFEHAGVPPRRYHREGDALLPDRLEDDQSIVINVEDKGLVVLSGCAHAGILNTVGYAQEISSVERVWAVIGGFHLAPVSDEEVDLTIDGIMASGPELVAPTHCTGFEATRRFAERMPEQFVQCVVGTVFRFWEVKGMDCHPLVTQLRFARREFVRCLEGVSAEDAVKRLEPMNCISWIVGHLASQEHFLWVMSAQGQNLAPNLWRLVGYGQPASTPPLDEMWSVWHLVTQAADRYLITLTDQDLASRHVQDGLGEDVGKSLLRNIYHYWFHTGEAHAIRQLLGHGELRQFVGEMSQVAYEWGGVCFGASAS